MLFVGGGVILKARMAAINCLPCCCADDASNLSIPPSVRLLILIAG
jgi:hypothetical protein